MKITFQKYQAAGNDFVLIDGLTTDISLEKNEIAKLCDRHFGIGADGLIVARPSDSAELFMDYYNSDGSVAEMCGNGIRSLAAFAGDNKLTNNTGIEIETRAGQKSVKLEDGSYVVEMGAPSYENSDIGAAIEDDVWDYPLEIDGREVRVFAVSMGNPHCVLISNDVEKEPVNMLGPLIENNPLFKNRTNVEWASVKGHDKLNVRVWERGAGYTLACGTGACAAFAVTNRLGLIGDQAIVSLPGGKLTVKSQNDILILKGDAEKVFEGTIEI